MPRELSKQLNPLLDEAMSDLNTVSECPEEHLLAPLLGRYIQSSIDGLKGEVIVVTIAHQLSSGKNTDRACMHNKEWVVEEGFNW